MQCSLKIESDGTHAGTTLRLRHAEQVDAGGAVVISNDLGGLIDRTTYVLGPARPHPLWRLVLITARTL